MKLLHISDLHLGKRINEFSLIEDQRHILHEILKITEAEMPDAVMIAGDIYDKSVPAAEAVQLFDEFLCCCAKLVRHIFIISGNHDSAERISFAGRIMSAGGVHIAPVYGISGESAAEPVTLNDEYGEVRIYMLPFIKPSNVKSRYPDEPAESYDEAVSTAIMHMNVDASYRNVLITHQFVTGAECSESEEIFAGGTESISADTFEAFDYTALGHLHKAQSVGTRIRYCGTPLKYSFSEISHQKSVTVAELRHKGDSPIIKAVPLYPLHDMREIKGTYDELTARSSYYGTKTDDYIHAVLTDENDIPDAVGRLRAIYPNIMKLDYENSRTRSGAELTLDAYAESKTPAELFYELYEMQNGIPATDTQRAFIESLIKNIWSGEDNL